MTATYLHLVCELLYNIEWPSVRRLRIGILCTYWNFVRALPYYVIELTQSQWDSGSWIESEVEDAKGKARSRVAASMDKLLTSLRLQTLSTGSYKGVMEEDGDINEDEVQ